MVRVLVTRRSTLAVTVCGLGSELSVRVIWIEVSIAGKVDDIVNGAAVFGPKIGQGFLQNLLGKFDPVTVDLWMRPNGIITLF